MRGASLLALLLANCLVDFDDFAFEPATQTTSTTVTTTTSGSGGATPATDVSCGAVTCDVSDGTTCCLTKPEGEGRCLPPGEECLGNETSVWCDGPQDCPQGEVCCGDTSVGFDLLQCEQDCSGAGEIVICDSSEQDPCPGNDDCVPSITLPDGYEVCN